MPGAMALMSWLASMASSMLDFVHDDQVGLQRLVCPVQRLAARTQSEDAMQRPCQVTRRLAHPFGRSPGGAASTRAAAWPWPASGSTGVCVLPVPGPPVRMLTGAVSAMRTPAFAQAPVGSPGESLTSARRPPTR